MKNASSTPQLFVIIAALLMLPLVGCATRDEAPTQDSPARAGKSAVAANDNVPAAAGAGPDDVAEVKVYDPVEPVNRGIFWFNHQLYTYAAKPFSKAYKFVFPEAVRKGVRNAYDNIRFPVRFVNHTLQGRLDRAAQETGRFVVNTTAGIGGVMTPAEKIPALAEVPKSDTGQTFAEWGVPHGPYLVFPVLGPTSTRDLVGAAGDTVLNPVSWIAFIFPGAGWTVAASVPSGAHTVPDRMDIYDMATKDALDPYISARNGYIQYRDAAAQR